MKFISSEFYRFILWGCVNTAAGYLIYALLQQFLPYLVSYSVAYILGIIIAYFLNAKFVFRQELRLSRAMTYPLVYLAQYLLGVISLYLLVRVLEVNKLLAPALIVLVTIPITYFLSGRIVASKG